MSCTLLACSAASRSTMPPLIFRCGFGRVCRLMMFTPSTSSRLSAGTTRRTRPRLPRSLPAITMTVSLRRIGVWTRDMWLQHLGRERDDLYEPSLSQFAGHGSEDTRPNRLVLIVDEDGGVPVEPDVTAIAAPLLL